MTEQLFSLGPCAVTRLVRGLTRMIRGLTRLAYRSHRLKPVRFDPIEWRLQARRHEMASDGRVVRISLYAARWSRSAGAIFLELCRREPLPGGGVQFVPLFSRVYTLLAMERTDHLALFDSSVDVIRQMLRLGTDHVPDAVLWEGSWP